MENLIVLGFTPRSRVKYSRYRLRISCAKPSTTGGIPAVCSANVSK
jgi:hypothetical protein